MDQLSVIGNTPTMTSREIAEIIGKQHSNIKISAERLSSSGVIGTLATQEFTHNGNEYTEYLLCKRDSLILVAQNCPEFTARIIDRWQELETRQSLPVELSRMQLISMAMEAEQERLILVDQIAVVDKKLAIAAPKAEALDRMALADGEVCLQTAGKLLQQPPNKFIAWLRSTGTWIFKRHGSKNNSAYTDKINAGYLNVRTTSTIMPDGSERVNEQVVVTPKGLAKLALMLGVQTQQELGGM
ncbi:phage antirepressor KilAC domain-containing protein [Propionivibrio sp.]|uniref:phage antirepressor KilAC domain-containing protein n=1 Tax=Propionivibrio sp. TaxID=2212460 RepID=UPI003BF2013D